MLRWLSSLTDSRPLGSVGGARKFVATLDRDIFAASDSVCTLLRSFLNDTEQHANLNPAPLFELDLKSEAMTIRLERDYLAASLQSHSLRERLWDTGYDWAMRFADAYRLILMNEAASVAGRSASEFARVAIRFFYFRAMAYRYRLYRHEEWIPAIWVETHQVFRKACDLGVDHMVVSDAANSGQQSYPARAFAALALLRLGNAGGYTPSQIHALYKKIEEFTYDLKLTARSVRRLRLPTVSPGLPASLLVRRPDVRNAEEQLAAADANVDVARKAFLPTITLSGLIGYQSANLANLIRPESLIFNAAAGLTQPIFDGGKLRGQLALSEAQRQQLLETYRKSILSALTDVETALIAIRENEERERALRLVVTAARLAFVLSEERLREGVIDLSTLLTTQNTLFQAEDALIQVRLARLQAVVSLFQALGGDWQEPADH